MQKRRDMLGSASARRRARRARAAARADRVPRFPVGLGPAYDPLIDDHALLGAVLGFDSEGRGLWDDSSYFEGDLSSAYEDVYQERIDLQYLEFLRRASLPYYGTSVGPRCHTGTRTRRGVASLATYLYESEFWDAEQRDDE